MKTHLIAIAAMSAAAFGSSIATMPIRGAERSTIPRAYLQTTRVSSGKGSGGNKLPRGGFKRSIRAAIKARNVKRHRAARKAAAS